jgi:hypothetical protein
MKAPFLIGEQYNREKYTVIIVLVLFSYFEIKIKDSENIRETVCSAKPSTD